MPKRREEHCGGVLRGQAGGQGAEIIEKWEKFMIQLVST